MTTRLIVALVSFVCVWSGALCYARMEAAKEKVGPGQPWMGEFIGLGWLKPTTPRGRMYAQIAKTLLWLGPVLFFAIFFAFAERSGTSGK